MPTVSAESMAGGQRARLFVAHSFDSRAAIGVIGVEHRTAQPVFHSVVVHSVPSPARLVEFALEFARASSLTRVDIMLVERSDVPDGVVSPPDRVRFVRSRRNIPVRSFVRPDLPD